MADRLQELLRLMAGLSGDDSDSDDSSPVRGRASSTSSSDSDDSELPRPSIPKSFSALKEAATAYLTEPETPLRPGDIVMWKQGCQNRKRPKSDEPVVVLEVLPQPLYGDEKSSGSPYFHEPLDVVLGMLDSDGDLVRYMYDKRRFRVVSTPDEVESASPNGKLHALALEFNKPITFRVGDAVMLKPGLRHRRIPDYTTLAVVAEVLPEPFRDTNAEEGTSSFYELISGRIAFLDNDGDIAFLYVDLRRFRKVN